MCFSLSQPQSVSSTTYDQRDSSFSSRCYCTPSWVKVAASFVDYVAQIAPSRTFAPGRRGRDLPSWPKDERIPRFMLFELNFRMQFCFAVVESKWWMIAMHLNVRSGPRPHSHPLQKEFIALNSLACRSRGQQKSAICIVSTGMREIFVDKVMVVELLRSGVYITLLSSFPS